MKCVLTAALQDDDTLHAVEISKSSLSSLSLTVLENRVSERKTLSDVLIILQKYRICSPSLVSCST